MSKVLWGGLVAVFLAIGVGTDSLADYRDGNKAYQTGDYLLASRHWRPLAEQGDLSAQFSLGALYWKGLGVPRNEAEAVKWFRKAAVQGLLHAQHMLGFALYRGGGVSQNYTEAAGWFRKAAEQGNAMSQHFLGEMNFGGLGVPQNDTEAVRWFRKAAEQGNASSQSFLGLMILNGRGVPQSDTEAVRWLRKAAEQGEATAQFMLGDLYDQGRGVSQNDTEADRWFREAAAQGNSKAQYSLGLKYLKGLGVPHDISEAATWFRKAAVQGHVYAQIALGRIYLEFLEVPQYAEAAKWFKKAAMEGYSEAQYYIGALYRDGNGVSQSNTEAAKWFRKAAEKGDSSAQFGLGQLYKHGQGLPQNEIEAFKWNKMAAKKGHMVAEHELALTYLTSDGYTDYGGEVVELLRKAAAKGNRLAHMAIYQIDRNSQQRAKLLSVLRERHGTAVAVVIGNKDYEGRIPDVDFAHEDANDFKRLIVDRFGFKSGNVIDLRDATLNDLTAVFGNDKNHEGKLFDWIRGDKSDIVIFYSGHGVPGLKDKRPYLLPVNGDPNRAELTGYSVDVLYSNLSKLQAKSVTVYIDACFSGDSPKGMIVQASSGISIEPRKPNYQKMITVIAAAQEDQLASWDEKAKHGIFTKHLLMALRGAADSKSYGNEDGEISLLEVQRYLDEEMTYEAKRIWGRSQRASVRGADDTKLSVVLPY